MAPSNTSFLHGWRLFVAVAVVLIAFALAAFALYPDAAEGSRAAIRVTARTSFLLFLAAFTAAHAHPPPRFRQPVPPRECSWQH